MIHGKPQWNIRLKILQFWYTYSPSTFFHILIIEQNLVKDFYQEN